MSIEQNIATLRRVIEEGFSKGNLDVLDDCFAPVYQEHQFDLARHPNVEGLKNAIRSLRGSFPDFTLTVDDLIADEDRVWVRLTGRGTQMGPMLGMPATGKTFAVTVFDECRFENGRIIEHWGVPDRFHQILQLGLLPRGEKQGR